MAGTAVISHACLVCTAAHTVYCWLNLRMMLTAHSAAMVGAEYMMVRAVPNVLLKP